MEIKLKNSLKEMALQRGENWEVRAFDPAGNFLFVATGDEILNTNNKKFDVVVEKAEPSIIFSNLSYVYLLNREKGAKK
jgi:hypothetical protein